MKRVLVVEDEPEWIAALGEMYRRIFAPEIEICFASSGTTALRMFEGARYSILSCDINLRSGGSITGRDADGRTVIRAAAERRVAVGLVVPTAITSDPHLSAIAPRNTEEMRVTWAAELPALFPGRFLVLPKSATLPPTQTADSWRQDFGERIRSLSESWPTLQPPYEISVSGTLRAPIVAIRGSGGLNAEHRVSDPSDALFFFHLAANHAAGVPTSDQQVVRIYGGNLEEARAARRQAGIKTEDVKMLLYRNGIDPDRLFNRARNEGWSLEKDTRVSGLEDSKIFGSHDWL